MKNKFKICSIFLTTGLFVILFTVLPYSIWGQSDKLKNTSATTSIKMSPAIFTPLLSPGKSVDYNLTIENLLNVPVPIALKLEDFNIEDKTGQLHLSDNKDQSVRNWVQISPKDLILSPKEKREITVNIKTPSEIPFGGYFGVVFAQIKLPGQVGASSLLNTQMGSLILANIGEPQTNSKKATLLSVPKLRRLLILKNSYLLNFEVKNNSLHHFVVRPHIRTYDLKGQKISQQDFTEKYIFPGKTRVWEENYTPIVGFAGVYKNIFTLSLGKGVELSETRYFLYLPWYLLIIIISVFTFSTYLIIKKYAYKKRCIKLKFLRI